MHTHQQSRAESDNRADHEKIFTQLNVWERSHLFLRYMRRLSLKGRENVSAWRHTNLGRRRNFLLPSCRKSLSTTRRIFMYVGFSCIVLMHKACTCLLGGREKSKYMLKTAATPPKITPRTWMQWGAARDVHTPSYQQVLSQTGTAQKKKQNEPHPKKLIANLDSGVVGIPIWYTAVPHIHQSHRQRTCHRQRNRHIFATIQMLDHDTKRIPSVRPPK